MTGRPVAELPQDINRQAIQALSPEDGTVVQATIGAGNSRVAVPNESGLVEVAVTAECRMAFGDSAVDASTGTRRALVAGVYVYRVPAGATHVAFTQIGSSTGVATVARMY